jgi:LmbE family N-acetylglucosaminyl deacetylase
MTSMERPVVVFLLAHQDDEFGVYFAIENITRQAGRAICIYLTDGGSGGTRPERRDTESYKVLRRLGVAERDIHFVGSRERFPDGRLHTRLDDALEAVDGVLKPIPKMHAIYMHAWEGGHQDHDAVHLIGVAYAAKAGLFDVSRQFALYRASLSSAGVVLFAPLPENGPVTVQSVSWQTRLRYLGLIFCYRSQWKSWIFLFPMLVQAYCTRGTQQTQGVSTLRLTQRPHAGPLLYERRGYATYQVFRRFAQPFVQARIVASPNQSQYEPDRTAAAPGDASNLRAC